jgi:TrmH family RNA methyltransferase
MRNERLLVEGEKNVKAAKDFIDFTFTEKSTKNFEKLVTTDTPQKIAAVAKLPRFTEKDVNKKPTIVILDHVQDPGNVGAILRLCQGFNASLYLIECADPTNPKVVRSSSGAIFSVPWKEIPKNIANEFIERTKRPIYKLEKKKDSSAEIPNEKNIVLIAGSEGTGITLDIEGTSITIPHDERLESLNVGNALAIILSKRFS